MKLTEVERAIVAITIIGTILDEYKTEEITTPIGNLKDKCKKFARKQSGVVEKMTRNKNYQMVMYRIIEDSKRNERYVKAVKIGDKIWKDAIDHFAKQKLTLDAVSIIEAVYLFHERVIAKHAKISRKDLDAYRYENPREDHEYVLNGTAVGGHLMGLLAKEQGEIVNGKLRAIKNKITDGK